MDILGSAKNISSLILEEYEKLFLEYQETGIIGSFKKIEELLYLENKLYEMLKDFELDWICQKLIREELAPIDVSFFDFFYCLEDDDKILYTRIISRCAIEQRKREENTKETEPQIAYFPLFSKKNSFEDELYQKYVILDCLHLHDFLKLLEENEYLTDDYKMLTKFYISYIFPFYENYFIKREGNCNEDLLSVYQIEKNFLDYKSDYFCDIYSDCYDSLINYEKENFSSINLFQEVDDAVDFIYLACYLKSFLNIRKGNKKLENSTYFKQIEEEVENHYKKVLQR